MFCSLARTIRALRFHPQVKMKFTALKLFCKEYIQVQKHAFTDCSLNKNSSSYGLIWREIMLLTLSRIIICYSKWTASLNLALGKLLVLQDRSILRRQPFKQFSHQNGGSCSLFGQLLFPIGDVEENLFFNHKSVINFL